MPLCLAFMACLCRVFFRPLAVRGLLIWFYFFLLFSRKTHVEDMSGKESKVTFFFVEFLKAERRMAVPLSFCAVFCHESCHYVV